MFKLTSILYEATRYKEETGESFPRWQDQIIKYEEKGGYFIHFSNVPRMNLYIVNKYNTPIGFYAYPLDRDKMSSFAVERPYAIIFKPKPEAKILEIKTYSESDYKADVDKLVDMGYPLEDIEKAAKEARSKKPAGKLWNVTRMLSGTYSIDDEPERTRGGGTTGKWSMLLKKLGYDGANDDCYGVIHPNESCQAVFFDTAKLDLVKIVDLKSAKISNQSDLFSTESRMELQAYDKKMSSKRLAFLAKSDNVRIRAGVAANENTSPEVLLALAKDKNSTVRLGVLGNPKAPPEVLTAAATSEDEYERMKVAENPNTPPEVLRNLANPKESYRIRRNVSFNENTPPDVLSELAKNDTEMFVRVGALSNSKIPVETLVFLANDTDTQVRLGVAKNRKTPEKILIELSKDTDRFVSNYAKRTLEDLGKLAVTESLILQKVFRKLLEH